MRGILNLLISLIPLEAQLREFRPLTVLQVVGSTKKFAAIEFKLAAFTLNFPLSFAGCDLEINQEPK